MSYATCRKCGVLDPSLVGDLCDRCAPSPAKPEPEGSSFADAVAALRGTLGPELGGVVDEGLRAFEASDTGRVARLASELNQDPKSWLRYIARVAAMKK